jgi:hypothetical protein
MFKSRTVFVVGAGASNEVGLPVGSELRDKIAQKVNISFEKNGTPINGDHLLYEQVKSAYPGNKSDVQAAGRSIAAGIYGRNSIDEYLDWQQSDKAIALFGKAAIVRCILEEEQKANHKYFGDTANFSLGAFTDAWYGELFRLLNQGYRREEVGSLFNNVSFIIFNYDRCLEHFLFCALQRMGLSANEAEEICSRQYTFYHPYGAVAPLRGEGSISFGSDRPLADYCHLALNIRTFSEQTTNHAAVAEIKQAMSDASTVVFLGFSYNEANLALLRTEESKKTHTNVFGTGFGLPGPFLNGIRGSIARSLNFEATHTFLEGHRCADFLRHFGAQIQRRF